MTTIPEMTVGDMFERVFRTLGKTFLPNLIIGLIVFIPVTILLALTLEHFVHAFAGLLNSIDDSDPESWKVLLDLLRPGLLLAAAIAAFSLADLLSKLAMMRIIAGEILENRTSWGDALGAMAGLPWLRALGMYILYGLAFCGLFLAPILLFLTGLNVMYVLGAFLYLGAIVVVIYLAIRWTFTLTAIAVEDAGVLDSFSRSSFLVSGHWWRTLGLLLLFGFVMQFAVSIVLAPVSIVAMWGFFSKYFELIFSMPHEQLPVKTVVELISSLGMGYAVLIGLSTMLGNIAYCSYMVAIYFDLRARKGEFGPNNTMTGAERRMMDQQTAIP
jgi:hypothetical protein